MPEQLSFNSLAWNATYSTAGQLTGWQEGNATMSRAYNATRGWMTNLTVTQGSSNTLNIDYGYNADGQVTSVTDHVNPGQSVSNYTYDSLNRLTGATATNWNMAWTYDDFGNRLTQTGSSGVPTSSLTYDTTNYTNRITTTGYSYDANGNLTAMPSDVGPSAMTYDVFDRLKTASGSTYVYDAYGRRIAKLNSSGSVTAGPYFYDMSGRRLDSGYAYFAGQRVGQWTDRVGTKRADSASSSHYYPYGEEITGTSNDTYKFAALFRDTDSGLDYAQKRFYSSSLGQFLTVDKLTVNPSPDEPQNWNGYAYSNGDPVNRFDPNGTDSCEVTGSGDGNCGADPITCDPLADVCPPGTGPGGPGGGGPPPTKPKKTPCWQNTGNISSTLNNLGTDIETDATTSGKFSNSDMQTLQGDINSAISSEMASIGGGTTSSPYYVGGHFNLDITVSSLSNLSAADQANFATLFGGSTSDGVRQSAQTGLAAALHYTLHSQNGADLAGSYNFHFDVFNPKGIGLPGHFFKDVVGGHMGHPCLDPAWAGKGSQ